MNVERLRLVVSALRAWPVNQFNYGQWVGDDWQGKTDLSCGTQACALGVATTIPELQALGLKLAKTNQAVGYVTIERLNPILDYMGHIHEYHTSIAAAMAVFDLTKVEAGYLFSPSEDYLGDLLDYDLDDSPEDGATPNGVADHIEAFIRAKLGL